MNVKMKRGGHISFCKKCLNRKMDMKQGLICGLTGEKATFEGTCPDFKNDEKAKKVRLDDEKGLKPEEIKKELPTGIIEKLKKEQEFDTGMVLGAVAGLSGAILWAVIGVSTGYHIGWIALIIGAGVGLTIRYSGKGIDNKFGVWGAIISLLSIFIGNFFSIIGVVAIVNNISFFEALIRFDYSLFTKVLAETFSFMDLVFYVIAAFEGYKFSFRVITEKRLHELKQISKQV